MTKNELIKQQTEIVISYSNKFKDTPIAQGLIKHGKENLLDKILSNFYFLAKKNPNAVSQWSVPSIVESLTKCCQWELIPDAIQACLIPYGKELTFQPMYQGLLEVAYRTGIFKSIVGNVVYEGDVFEYDIGGDCYVKHQLDLHGARDRAIAVYADVKLLGGGRIVKVMTIKEVKKIQSKAKNKSIWSEYWDQMAIKTAIKQVFKLCPKSEGLAELVAYDNSLEQNFDRLPDATKATNLNALLGHEPEPETDEPGQTDAEDQQDFNN
jgi:recombination protein RecT